MTNWSPAQSAGPETLENLPARQKESREHPGWIFFSLLNIIFISLSLSLLYCLLDDVTMFTNIKYFLSTANADSEEVQSSENQTGTGQDVGGQTCAVQCAAQSVLGR